MKKGKALNPYKDGTARTIKSQYWKNGITNFIVKDAYGATGVIRKYEGNSFDAEENGVRKENP